jgi:hypothetical protein
MNRSGWLSTKERTWASEVSSYRFFGLPRTSATANVPSYDFRNFGSKISNHPHRAPAGLRMSSEMRPTLTYSATRPFFPGEGRYYRGISFAPGCVPNGAGGGGEGRDRNL